MNSLMVKMIHFTYFMHQKQKNEKVKNTFESDLMFKRFVYEICYCFAGPFGK